MIICYDLMIFSKRLPYTSIRKKNNKNVDAFDLCDRVEGSHIEIARCGRAGALLRPVRFADSSNVL